jgi:hypothetical protein
MNISPKQVEVLYKNRSHGFLTPVNIHVNARVKRNKNRGTELKLSDTSPIYEGGKLWDAKKEGR